MDLSSLDDEFYEEFIYNIPTTETQKQLEEEIIMYMRENERWQKKSYKVAAVNARRHLRNIIHLSRRRAKEIQEIKTRLG